MNSECDNSVEINNTNMYKNPNQDCVRCGEKLSYGITFHNIPANCEKRKTYTYMEIGRGMHAECYIEHVIDIYLSKRLENESITK
jgi:hypothetical protein